MQLLCKLLFCAVLVPEIFFASLAKVYSFSLGDIKLLEETYGETYTHVSLYCYGNTASDIGLPWLPYKDVIFIIPPDEMVESVDITTLDSAVVKAPCLPLPMQYPATSLGNPPFVSESPGYYASQSPGAPASLLRHGVSADANLAVVRLYPVQFDPRTLTLKLYTDIGISLATSPSATRTMKVARDSLGRIDRIRFIQELVENPEDVKGCLEQSWQGSVVSSVSSQEKMAIVTSPQFVPAFTRLALWKTQKGCSTGVYTTDKIGTSSAELLGFIRGKVESGCEYILLGGGEGVIPIRTSCYHEPYGGSSFTDLYYADCSNETSSSIWDAWNENHNQYYGEPYADHIIVKGISFADENQGWMAGNGRSMGGPVVVKTEDGGRTWNECAFLEFGLAYDLEFVDAQVGFIVGNFGIARSADGGINWELVWDDDTSSYQVSDLDFYGDEMWAVGSMDNYPLFLRSRDGGLTWLKVELLNKELYKGTAFVKVDVVSGTKGWVVGSNTIQRVEMETSSGNLTFTEEWRGIHQPSVSFWGCGFFNAEWGSVYGYGDLRYRLYTRSASTGWVETTPDTTDAYFSLNDVCVTDNPQGRIFAFGNQTYISDSYGMHWTAVPELSMPTGPRSAFLETNPALLWVAGEYRGYGENLILKSSNANQPEPQWDSIKTPVIVGDVGVDEWMPDVATGRLPVTNLEEAYIAVDKIIAYEKNPPYKDFAERALFMSANMESNKNDFSSLKAVASAADLWASNPSRKAWRLFNPLSGEGFSGNEINNSLNATRNFESGYNFICHIDHGTAAQFGTGYKIPGLAPYNRLFSPDIAALDNEEDEAKQSVVYSAACAVAQYTREVDPKNPVLGGNIAVEFLRNPHAGALTFIGGVDDVDRTNGNSLATELTKALFIDTALSTGWALIAAVGKVGSQSLAYNMHLLGDPSLRIYTEPLDSFSTPLSWTLDSRGFDITLNDAAGGSVSGADVCLYMPGKVYRITRSNDQGEARIPAFDPPAGVLTLTVSARNFISYQEEISTGEISTNPLAVNSSYPGARIAVDLEGNLHLVYTDSLYGRLVARYGFSADTGKTWSLSPVDPEETRSTFAPGLVLPDGLDPCIAYLVQRGGDSTTLRLANLNSARRFDIAALSQKPAGVVSLAAGPSELLYIVVRTLPKLRYYKVDLASAPDVVLESNYYPLPLDGSDTLASTPALVLLDSVPLVLADTRTAPDSPMIYAWLPLSSGQPFRVTEGEKPSAAAAGRSFTMAYLEDDTARVLTGYLADSGSLCVGSPQQVSGSVFNGVAALGSASLVLTGEGSWFAHNNGTWKFYEITSDSAYSPHADLNFNSGIAAAAWHEPGLVRVSAAELGSFPQGHSGAFPGVSVESPGPEEIWPMEIVEPIAWFQTKETDSVFIELSTDSAQSFKRIAARGWREPGLHYFHWEVGRLANKAQIPKPEESYPSSFIRVICGSDTALSGRFVVSGESAESDFAAGSDPTGKTFYADSQVTTNWLYTGCYGCKEAELELSLDGGETFSQLASGAPQKFWSLASYQGSLVWQVPDTAADSACLRLLVRDTLDNVCVCLSGLFSILVIPDSVVLYDPFPNPCSGAATISYSIPNATHVSVKVYDVTGRLVTKLVDEEVLAGAHTLLWEGRDDINRRCASGVYFVRFEAEDYALAKKIVLIN